jgi:hypothetical protein
MPLDASPDGDTAEGVAPAEDGALPDDDADLSFDAAVPPNFPTTFDGGGACDANNPNYEREFLHDSNPIACTPQGQCQVGDCCYSMVCVAQ